MEKTEEKKPVHAMAGADEFKLTLGGYIQTQFEGGDPFAVEGKFKSDFDEVIIRLQLKF